MNTQATYEQVEILMDPGDYDRDPSDRRDMTVLQAAALAQANIAARRETA